MSHTELKPGKRYFCTWAAYGKRTVKLISIDEKYSDGGALITVEYRGTLYSAGSNQLIREKVS